MPLNYDYHHTSADNLRNHLIRKDCEIRDALEQLNDLSGGNLTLFVVDADDSLCGSLTDGDIRRALVGDISLTTPVGHICNRNCLRISTDDSPFDIAQRAVAKGITLLPVVERGKVVRLEDLRTRKALLPLDAVLMAGGKGERLRPLTLRTPKPLLPVAGKPIIAYNIDLLYSYGIDNIFVTVNYLKEQIADFFATGNDSHLPRVECIAEPTRLGTMGSLSLIYGLTHENLIVMNSDLLTTIDFEKMFLYHKETEAALTMGCIPYNVSVPYAIVRQEDGIVKGMSEKPTFTYLANAGIYMMRREVADSIPHGEYLDAPELIETLIARGEKVVSFPIDGTWIDIGNPDDYAAADRLMSTAKNR